MQVIKQDQVQEKIIIILNQKVIVDSDVAELYGVETKHINQAVKNNIQKFPDGYVFELNKDEWEEVKSKFLTSLLGGGEVKSKFSASPLGGGKVKRPNVFTEKGLYMLATILKSPKAIETTLAIIETFTKVRELSSAVNQLQTLSENSPKQKTLLEHTGQLMTDLIATEDELEVMGTETTYEMNFAVFKIKRTIKKGKQ